MAEEPVRDALGVAILRGAFVQLAGGGGELGVVTSTGGGTVGITIGGRRERYSRPMSGIIMTVVPPDGGCSKCRRVQRFGSVVS